MSCDGVALLVLSRKPVPGRVKTRLIGVLGEEGAAQLQRGLLTHALTTAGAAGFAAIELHCAPDCDDPFLHDCARRYHATLYTQSNGDLGERMAHALEGALSRHAGAVLIGGDAPSLTVGDLRAAGDFAGSDRLVIVPAEDGGYVLIGMGRRQASHGSLQRFFAGIPWGSGEVMIRQRQRLTELGEQWEELAPRWDVDRPADLVRLQGLAAIPSISF